jgi:RNA polymerase sigma factor (sigma-70 family)
MIPVLSCAAHAALARLVKGGDPSWPDARLVRECLRGSEEAWSALLDKYKNLVYSIPLKQGMSRDAAGDVFQRVCLLLLSELPHLRKAEALPMWLIRVTARECGRWRAQERPHGSGEEPAALAQAEDGRPLPEETLAQLAEEQELREAVRGLSPRCRELVTMLFFEDPPRSYADAARTLGLASNSVAFIRARCLARLRKDLEKARPR